ncbi:MAG TPA: prephenate dehydratase domain-containing protein [Chloroflexota bacterium]|jgi:prephenate dehydratase
MTADFTQGARKPIVGALGGPGTFASQAAQHLRALYPEWGEVRYAPTGDELWAALAAGRLDVLVQTAETDQGGFSAVHARLAAPDAGVYVIAEAVVPYGCALLAKPGTRLADVRQVLGHGSVQQCRQYLDAHLPRATVTIHGQNSMAAAEEVAAGDGSLALVGTRLTAETYGLAVLATDIDGGSVANFWALARRPDYADVPTRLYVAGRLGGDGALGDVIARLTGLGPRLRTVYARPSGQHLFEYDYVLAFAGAAERRAVEQALTPFPTLRLTGAFVAR